MNRALPGVLLLCLVGCASLTKPRYVTGQALTNTGTRASQLHNFSDEQEAAIVATAKATGQTAEQATALVLVNRKMADFALGLLKEAHKDVSAIAQSLGLKESVPAGGAR